MYNWELIVCLIGFIAGYIIYTKTQYRAGGVIIVPMFAIYFIYYPFLTLLLILNSFFVWIMLEIIFRTTLIYGRRLMYISNCIAIVSLMIIINVVVVEKFIFMEWFPVLSSGMLAYNLHREFNSKIDTSYSYIVSVLYLMIMIIIGIILMVMF